MDVNICDNLADIFTKGLPRPLHEDLVKHIGVLHTKGECCEEVCAEGSVKGYGMFRNMDSGIELEHSRNISIYNKEFSDIECRVVKLSYDGIQHISEHVHNLHL
jgi:hypothetical protein